jgi:hypothetical protein
VCSNTAVQAASRAVANVGASIVFATKKWAIKAQANTKVTMMTKAIKNFFRNFNMS